MFEIDIGRFVPRFIMKDREGRALAKAIEAGLNYMNAHVQTGVDLIADYETMPEWRLDELAWELNCLYDAGASVEQKRSWIRSALPMYRIWGTPQAIHRYLGGYFDSVELEEGAGYGGDPFHFRVTVEGEWTPDRESWARQAISTAKNARSVADGLRIGHISRVAVRTEDGTAGRVLPPVCGETSAGLWP